MWHNSGQNSGEEEEEWRCQGCARSMPLKQVTKSTIWPDMGTKAFLFEK
jgi:hypothetical protein